MRIFDKSNYRPIVNAGLIRKVFQCTAKVILLENMVELWITLCENVEVRTVEIHDIIVPYSETVLSLWRPPEPGMHCRPASDLHRRLEFSAANWRLTCSTSLFRNNLTKSITNILIWLTFYAILSHFILFSYFCTMVLQQLRQYHFKNTLLLQ